MTRDQLLEYAALDAFDLLEDYEGALYTRSFHHAAAAVQDEILALQAELVSDVTLLGDDSPPAELRARVLRAVSQAIDTDAGRLQPIARIGRTRVAGVTAAAGRFKLSLAGQFWRAAAFALAATTIVGAYLGSQAWTEYARITKHVLGLELDEQIRQDIGPELYDNFIAASSNTRKTTYLVNLAPAEYDACTVWHVVRTSEQGNTSVAIFGKDLALKETYTVVLIDSDTGRETHREQFEPNATFWGHQLDLTDTAVIATATWELRNSTGQVLFRSA
jgi:hypothetical protein